MPKFVFVTGGVVSSIGKGITCASLGCLLKNRGIKVTIQKFDPYINVDAGTMNPYQHGEVFVTEDGAETDLDLGHYERFINESLSSKNNVTTGKIYAAVIAKERRGDYLGDTVRVIPHITNQIKQEILTVACESQSEIAIVEVGGTVGDIEGLPFLEAIRQFKNDIGEKNVAYVHVTLVPHLGAAGELKTKPTQHSVKELRAIGISPDFIVCRTDKILVEDILDKIALHCDVPRKNIFQITDAGSLYEVPILFERQQFSDSILDRLEIKAKPSDLVPLESLVHKMKNPTKGKVTIALVGKYIELKDAYISIVEALKHGAAANDVGVQIKKVDAELLTRDDPALHLKEVHGILVPGGFGSRGLEGKVKAIQFARENNIPFFGICYGLQCAVVEFARNVCHWKDANSSEVNPRTQYPVIDLITDQHRIKDKGATMRLGLYDCKISPNSKAQEAYKELIQKERHRHRYEFNNKYLNGFMEHGLFVTGVNPDRNLVEIIEIPTHPWFLATQFHPEFQSRPENPHPLFREFIHATYEYTQEKVTFTNKLQNENVSVHLGARD